MIDETSRKILNELCKDGRTNNVQLSKKLEVNVATVAKKINSLIESGVMVFKALPNPRVMGNHAQAVICLSVDPRKRNQICETIVKNVHVTSVATCLGRFDVMLIVFFPDLQELHDYITKDLKQIHGVYSIQTFFAAENIRGKDHIFQDYSVATNSIVLDALDRKIIAELVQDGRPNYADLSKKLGTSKPTISRRINSLVKTGVIKILAIPNPAKLDYSANAYILLNATEGSNLGDIRNHLLNNTEVHLIMELMNDFDMIVGVYSTNLDTLYSFLEKTIWGIEGVFKTEILICGNFFYISATSLCVNISKTLLT